MAGKVAAVSCGTNSTRMLVADAHGTPIERVVRVTRLGEGVDATGLLSDRAMARTLGALGEFRRRMGDLGVARARAAATSAARGARNRDAFLAAAGDALGMPFEVLDGDQEARLAFRGATAGLGHEDGMVLVVDIGGGSTELAVGPAGGRRDPVAVTSIDVGCVRLSERVLRTDPPTSLELEAALAVVEEGLAGAAGALPAGASRMVAMAGIVADHWAVEERLIDLGGGAGRVLGLDAAEDLLSTLASLSRSERARRPGREEALADVVVAGAALLVGVMRFFGMPECVISEADILDGLVHGLIDPE